MFSCVCLPCQFVLCVFGAGYLLCSLCGFFFVVSCSVVCSVLCLSVGISFCSEVWPVLGWRPSGMKFWRGRVLSSGGLWGWVFIVYITQWGWHNSKSNCVFKIPLRLPHKSILFTRDAQIPGPWSPRQTVLCLIFCRHLLPPSPPPPPPPPSP